MYTCMCIYICIYIYMYIFFTIYIYIARYGLMECALVECEIQILPRFHVGKRFEVGQILPMKTML